MPSSFLFGLFFWREGVEPLPYGFYRGWMEGVGEGLCALPCSNQSLRHGYRRATSLYKGGALSVFSPTAKIHLSPRERQEVYAVACAYRVVGENKKIGGCGCNPRSHSV